ncbi:MAG TPA: hypothetical protein P5084_02235, partial [Paludibacter sp.]|nr:hypothetical protein [Paludibacter sp.]
MNTEKDLQNDGNSNSPFRGSGGRFHLDLSSKITLERTPERYYRSTDMLENLRQTRYEKLRTNIYADASEGAIAIAQQVAELIRNKEKEGKACVLGLSGGFSPLGVYDELVRMHREEDLSFAHVVV